MARGRTTALIASLLTALLLTAACGGDDDPTPTPTGDAGDVTPAAAGDGPIAVSLEVSDDPHAEGDPLEVTVSLENVTTSAVTVVRPYLVPAPVIFIVTDANGTERGYQGIFGERRPLTADRFVELEPGESTSETFDLADGYRLPPGEYEVIASYRNADNGGDHGLSAFLTDGLDYSSPPVTIEVE